MVTGAGRQRKLGMVGGVRETGGTGTVAGGVRETGGTGTVYSPSQMPTSVIPSDSLLP